MARLGTLFAFSVLFCTLAKPQTPVSPHVEGAVQCFTSPTPGKRPADMPCAMIAMKTFRSLPSGELTWRVETFPDLSAARRAETPLSVVSEARGKVWLLTIGRKGTRTPGARFLTEVGPLPIPPAPEYEMIVLDGDLPPKSNVLVHTHSGPEAWYVLSGRQCLDLPGRAIRATAGEAMFAPAETPMRLNIETQRDAFFMVVHDKTKPWNTLSDWKPHNVCGDQ
jgi:quercetin dioxygenase-like cupin family protein